MTVKIISYIQILLQSHQFLLSIEINRRGGVPWGLLLGLKFNEYQKSLSETRTVAPIFFSFLKRKLTFISGSTQFQNSGFKAQQQKFHFFPLMFITSGQRPWECGMTMGIGSDGIFQSPLPTAIYVRIAFQHGESGSLAMHTTRVSRT